MGYDPALGRFTQADSIIPQPGNPLDWDRYSYVRNSPVNYTDPTGHKVCSDDGYCGMLGSIEYQRYVYTSAITGVLGWELQGNWNLQELKNIYKAGNGIRSFVNTISGEDSGLAWINEYLAGATFTHQSLASTFGLDNPHVFPGNVVALPAGWEQSPDSFTIVVHELAHIWDNNTGVLGMGTYLGGGVADALNQSIGGNVTHFPANRFYNPNNPAYLSPFIPDRPNIRWSGSKYYGNGCTADYLAEAFAWGIYAPALVPSRALYWVKSTIAWETSQLP